MQHNDDAFATILLTSQVTPHREELVKPLSVSEYHQLREDVQASRLLSLGALINLDMSGIMLQLGVTEREAYRLCILLARTLPLSISLEGFYDADIDVVTIEDKPYPENMRARLGRKAPPLIYFSGRQELFRYPSVAVLGSLPPIGGAEERVRSFVQDAVENGFVIITDGADGLGRIAEEEAFLCDGRIIEVLSDSLAERVKRKRIAQMLKERRILLLSSVHPETPYIRSNALTRNKYIYALALAAVVFAADENRGSTWEGATEALRNRWNDFIYAWDTDLYSGNRALVARGAMKYGSSGNTSFEQMMQAWHSAAAEQICMFDWGDSR